MRRFRHCGMKKTGVNRVLSWLCSLIMIFSICSQNMLYVSAEEQLSETAVTEQADVQQEDMDSQIEAQAVEIASETASETANETVSETNDLAQSETDGQTEEQTIAQEIISEVTEEQTAADTQNEQATSEPDTRNTEETETASEESEPVAVSDDGEAETVSEETAEGSEQESDETETESESQGISWNEELITGKQTFQHVTVEVTAPEGSFPEGTTVTITPVAEDKTQEILNISEDDPSEAVAFDITFRDLEGNELEPQNDKTVVVIFSVESDSVLSEKEGEQAKLEVLHVDEDGSIQKVAENTKLQENSSAEVFVEATSFSIYALKKSLLKNARKNVRRAPSAGSDASSHFHATISTNSDSYTSGATAMYTVDYTIDQNSIKEGDYITVSIPADMYKAGARLSVNKQHFSKVVDNGDGTYRLEFGPDADTALSGSFSMFITTSESGQKTVTVGDSSATITVNAANTSQDSGGTALGYRLNKDAYITDGVLPGGYDYGDTKSGGAAQVSVYDSTEDKVITYRLYVNGNQESLKNVTVKDTLPDGETYVNTDKITLTYVEKGRTIGPVNPSDYVISFSGKSMTITFKGTLTQAVEVVYYAKAEGGDNVRYVNNVKMTYEKTDEPGKTYQDERDNILLGNNNSAANGTKSVSKTTVSADGDQRVRYSLTFWNSNGFPAGTINLTDDLNPYVKYEYADPNDYFTVTDTKKTNADGQEYDSLAVTNTKAIEGSTSITVSFVVDFSNVPAGSVVENTTGGNVVRTFKTGAVLSASKVVTGGLSLSDREFSFTAEQVTDSTCSTAVEGGITQTAKNDADGNISFDQINLVKEGTYWFKISENAGTDSSISYDSNYFLAKIVMTAYTQKVNSVIATTLIPTITYYDQKGNALAEGSLPTFSNGPKTGSLEITKTTNGATTPDDTEFTITGPNGYSQTVKYSEFKDGKYTLENLPVGEYM